MIADACGHRQEALVTSYINDANSRRQFEDAASLSFSLIELREEIARLRLNPIS
jgi:rabenosyn-5